MMHKHCKRQEVEKSCRNRETNRKRDNDEREDRVLRRDRVIEDREKERQREGAKLKLYSAFLRN